MESGLALKDEHSFQISECPRQVPKGIDIIKVESQATDSKLLMYTLMYVQMLV